MDDIWWIFNALGWLFWGCIWCITIVGIPVGLQCFKLAGLQLAPFGKEVVTVDDGAGNLILNILWIVFGGFTLAIGNLISATMFAITIIGIPFAIQSLKLAKLSLMPFGKVVR